MSKRSSMAWKHLITPVHRRSTPNQKCFRSSRDGSNRCFSTANPRNFFRCCPTARHSTFCTCDNSILEFSHEKGISLCASCFVFVASQLLDVNFLRPQVCHEGLCWPLYIERMRVGCETNR